MEEENARPTADHRDPAVTLHQDQRPQGHWLQSEPQLPPGHMMLGKNRFFIAPSFLQDSIDQLDS